MEALKIYITITQTNEVVLEDKSIRMILFDGICKSDYFNGKVLSGGVDTQIVDTTGVGTLSARYILKGYDGQQQPCSIFIENNGVIGDGEIVTHPQIYTDSSNLKWLETKALIGKVSFENEQLVVTIYA